MNNNIYTYLSFLGYALSLWHLLNLIFAPNPPQKSTFLQIWYSFTLLTLSSIFAVLFAFLSGV